jgi:hypothetical protein
LEFGQVWPDPARHAPAVPHPAEAVGIQHASRLTSLLLKSKTAVERRHMPEPDADALVLERIVSS